MKSLLLALIFSAHTYSFAQDFNKDTFLSELSANACTCIETIEASNKSPKDIASEIRDCIDEQTSAYQLGMKLAAIDTAAGPDKKDIKISLDLDKNSKEYKEYYFAIERYLMQHCAAIKAKIATADKLNKHSLSENPKALKLYYEGIEDGQAGAYEKAIKKYKKALAIDPLFAFAWDNIGISYRKLNKYDKALAAYQKSLEIDPEGLMPLQNIPIVYQYKKEYQQAIEAYKKLNAISPDNPEVYYGIGQIAAIHLKNYEEGLDNMCKAYNLYIEHNSPYRTDAEKVIQYIYKEMEKAGNSNAFFEILKKNGITPNQ